MRNFVQLCLEGYYDGCSFFRLIKDLFAQTGDPSNSGRGACPCAPHPLLVLVLVLLPAALARSA